MKFTKGTSGNLSGRPKGKKPIKSRIEELLEKNIPLIEQQMENANPQDRKTLFVDLFALLQSTKKRAI